MLYINYNIEWILWKYILLQLRSFVHCVWKFNGYGSSAAHFANTKTKQDRRCPFNRNIVARMRKYFWSEKAEFSTYSECTSLALSIHRAKRIFYIMLSCFPYLAAPYFSTLSDKRHNFQRRGYLTQSAIF